MSSHSVTLRRPQCPHPEPHFHTGHRLGRFIMRQEARAILSAVPASVRVSRLSYMRGSANCVMLSRTILLRAVEIKHAQA